MYCKSCLEVNVIESITIMSSKYSSNVTKGPQHHWQKYNYILAEMSSLFSRFLCEKRDIHHCQCICLISYFSNEQEIKECLSS